MATVSSLVTALVLSALLFLISSAQGQSNDKPCWFPDGSVATKDTPCDANSDVSPCCGPGSLCLVNGLCLNYGSLSRGSCTDPTWKSSSCTLFCQGYGQGVQIIPCYDAGSFACGSPQFPDQGSCNHSFQIPPSGLQIALKPDQASSLAGTDRVTIDNTKGIQGITASNVCPAQATVTTTPGFKFSVSLECFSDQVWLTVLSVTSSSIATSAATDSPTGGSETTNVGAIAGGTIGGVAALAALAVSLWFYVRQKRNANNEQATAADTTEECLQEMSEEQVQEMSEDNQTKTAASAELDSGRIIGELDNTIRRAELDGS